MNILRIYLNKSFFFDWSCDCCKKKYHDLKGLNVNDLENLINKL